MVRLPLLEIVKNVRHILGGLGHYGHVRLEWPKCNPHIISYTIYIYSLVTQIFSIICFIDVCSDPNVFPTPLESSFKHRLRLY